MFLTQIELQGLKQTVSLSKVVLSSAYHCARLYWHAILHERMLSDMHRNRRATREPSSALVHVLRSILAASNTWENRGLSDCLSMIAFILKMDRNKAWHQHCVLSTWHATKKNTYWTYMLKIFIAKQILLFFWNKHWTMKQITKFALKNEELKQF